MFLAIKNSSTLYIVWYVLRLHLYAFNFGNNYFWIDTDCKKNITGVIQI